MSETTAPWPYTGLTAAEVAERISLGQINRVRRSDAADYADIFRRNVITVFNALVVPAAVALLALGDYPAGISVSGMMLINTLLGLAQELRAKRHLDRLALLTEAKARVLRDGQGQEIAAGDVVLGDYLLLAAGDAVVADGPLVESRFLEIDEALLTGESDPVSRRPGETLLSGSFTVAGEGTYRAARVGLDAFAQRTTREARTYHYRASPMQKALDQLIMMLTSLAISLSAVYLFMYFQGLSSRVELFRWIAATITSTVPQGLVLMATLAFLLGAVRMSKRGAVVQRLNAVESMAAVDVLCLDKTGTLTTNRLKLEQLLPLSPEVTEEAVKRSLRWFASTSLDHGSKVLAAVRESLGTEKVELLDQVPFKSQNRYSAVSVNAGNGEHRLAMGAVEALQPLLTVDGEPHLRAEVDLAWRRSVQAGLRVLLFAEVRATETDRRMEFAGSLAGFTLHPLALIGFSDELRPSARHVLEQLAEQGIAFKIISGDNPETVRTTIQSLVADSSSPVLRALAELPVVTGADLEQSKDPGELIRAHAVFGRVAPKQKVEIVQTLQAQGRFVAMIGDGVNDVLPIKHAQLGIAMGDGSRAARTVSGLVLESNDFGLLPLTLDEGRTILRNLRRSSKLFLVKNFYALFLIVGGLGLLGLPFPFLPQQVTLLNLLTIGVPAFLITMSRRKFAAPSRPGFLREVASFVFRTGLIIGLAGLTMLYLSNRVWLDEERTQKTMLLSTLVLLGLTTLLRSLTDGEDRLLRGDRRFAALAVGGVLVYLAAMYWSIPAKFLELTPLTLSQWAWVLAIAGAAYLPLFAWDKVVSARLPIIYPPRP